MTRLWIADVHANLPAFAAVLEDAGAVDEIVFLGDIVGYGPHPAECVERLAACSATAILGNHDGTILARTGGPLPFHWDQWTRDRLSPDHVAYLENLPSEREIAFGNDFAKLRHQVPGAPYLHPAMPDEVLAECLTVLPDRLLVCGHSHRAIDRSLPGRRFICLPAVGQPRNRDPRAGYAIERDGELEFRFVPYDIERVVEDLAPIGLEESFHRRWVRFLRTGHDPEWSRDYQPQAR